MNSDKAIKLLEYITKRYDIMLEERCIFTSLYPKDICIFVQGKSLSETLEKFCRELVKYSSEQFKEGLEEILNEKIYY